MKKGFERLRHIAVASSMGLGLLGGGSARAATVALPVTKLARGSAEWLQVGNASLGISSSNNSLAITTNNGIAITPSETAFAIDDAQLTNGLDIAFNAALFMAAQSKGTTTFFANPPDAGVDLTGDNLKSDPVINFVAGINAQINYYFHPTRPLVRALYSFTNTTGTAIPIEVLIGGTLGSVGSTTIQASSDNNTTSDAADLWIISNNKTLGNDPNSSVAADTPVITLSRFGNGAATPAVNALTLGNFAGVFGHRYDFTVAANSTAHVLVFAELNKTIADAKICAKDFETLDAADASGLLTGLSTTITFADIVNYAAATGAVFVSTCSHTASGTNTTTDTSTGSSSTTNSNTTTDSSTNSNTTNSTTSNTTTSTKEKDLSTGALDLASLTTLLGLLGLSRVRKKESS